MSTEQPEKLEDLLVKMQTLRAHFKVARERMIRPILDRRLNMMNKLLKSVNDGGEQQPEQPVLRCEKCNCQVAEGMKFCYSCSNPLTPESRRERKETEELNRYQRMSISM